MGQPQGYSREQIMQIARSQGVITINQYDQNPRAIRFRRAVYRAVEAGLLVRVKGSRPSSMIYRPAEAPQ